jgi:hypothetical protein
MNTDTHRWVKETAKFTTEETINWITANKEKIIFATDAWDAPRLI